MSAKLISEPVRRWADARGVVFEPLTESALAIQKNAHVVVSRPGVVRGNHYHLKGCETLVVCGPALIRVRDQHITEDITVPPATICRLTIPPGVAHAVKNTGSSDNLLVAFNTEPRDPDTPDVVADILIPP